MAKYDYPETPEQYSLDARIRVVLDEVADDGELWEAGRDAFFDALIGGRVVARAVECAIETALVHYEEGDEKAARRKAGSQAWSSTSPQRKPANNTGAARPRAHQPAETQPLADKKGPIAAVRDKLGI